MKDGIYYAIKHFLTPQIVGPICTQQCPQIKYFYKNLKWKSCYLEEPFVTIFFKDFFMWMKFEYLYIILKFYYVYFIMYNRLWKSISVVHKILGHIRALTVWRIVPDHLTKKI